MSFQPTIHQDTVNDTINTSFIALLISIWISISTNGTTESGHINIFVASQTPPETTTVLVT